MYVYISLNLSKIFNFVSRLELVKFQDSAH